MFAQRAAGGVTLSPHFTYSTSNRRQTFVSASQDFPLPSQNQDRIGNTGGHKQGEGWEESRLSRLYQDKTLCKCDVSTGSPRSAAGAEKMTAAAKGKKVRKLGPWRRRARHHHHSVLLVQISELLSYCCGFQYRRPRGGCG